MSQPQRRWADSHPRAETRIFFALIAILAIILSGWVAWFVAQLQAPSFAYENVAVAGPTELCPGQQLVINFDARSKSEPLILEIVENVADADTGLPVISDTQPAFVINRANGVLHLTTHFTIPLLPAGRYEYRRAADSSITRPIAFSVPFTVPADCPPVAGMSTDIIIDLTQNFQVTAQK